MKKYSFIFFIKQSLNGLFMNSVMSITSIFILTSCLILTGCSVLLIFNADLNLEQLNSLNKIVFFIDKNYESEEEIERIKEQISSLSNTDNIRFISKEEALEKEREKYEEAFTGGLFEQIIKDNPLEHSIEIEYKSIDDVGTLNYQLQSIVGVAKNDKGEPKIRNYADIAETIKNIKNVIMYVLIGFLIILFVIAVFIILNTVRLTVFSRKNEIIIMRYIGATNFFILFPFLLEGIIIGLVSAIIAYLAQSYIYKNVVIALLKRGDWLEFIEFSEINIMLFAAFLVTGVLCGLFGSGISSRKYLKA